MELWTGVLSWWKCHWLDLKSARIFWGNLLKPQHSNPNPNPLANQLWSIDFLTPPTPLIIPHRLPGFLESLIPLKNWCSIHARWSKSNLKHSIRFCSIFPSLKHVQIAFLKFTSCNNQALVGCIPIPTVAVHLTAEIIKIGQSSHKIYSNNILNFQESTTILNAYTKKKSLETYWRLHVYWY